MYSKNFNFRLVEERDSHSLLSLRNDDLTREMSFNTQKISLREHEDWFQSAIQKNDFQIYICEDNDGIIGTGRIDLKKGSEFLSWNVHKSRRGNGFGSKIIKFLLEKADGTCFAQIKKNNTPSLKIAKNNGFVEHENHEDFVVFKYIKR